MQDLVVDDKVVEDVKRQEVGGKIEELGNKMESAFSRVYEKLQQVLTLRSPSGTGGSQSKEVVALNARINRLEAHIQELTVQILSNIQQKIDVLADNKDFPKKRKRLVWTDLCHWNKLHENHF